MNERMNVTIKITKEHLEVIDKEFERMHTLIKASTEEGEKKWARERIEEMQTSLLRLKDPKNFGLNSEDDKE
jgi:hypothetical protein